jgi:5-(carboxyamino)imidazole ribonucleotide mutase
MKKIVIIMGSETDGPHAEKITARLAVLGYQADVHVASAHKQPRKVLEIIDSYAQEEAVVYITIAGRSNALSGFTAANTDFPVLACPPFADKVDMLVNIHSTLQMPSSTPVLTVLDPGNAALAAVRILALAGTTEQP